MSFAIAARAAEGGPEAPPKPAHAWERIDYPPLPVPGLETAKLDVLVGSGSEDGKPHLRFDVMWSAPRNAMLPEAIADASNFVVKLHLGDGTVVVPEAGRPPRWFGAGGAGTTWSITYLFPWQRNAMDEAWIEFGLLGRTYWVEMPYGFARNPADPPPTDGARSEPVFPPAMKTLRDNDRLVPWLHVSYDLGQIQNGWRLFLKMANPFDAQAEAVLYRDDMAVGKSIHLWKLDTPRTAMEIKTQGGGVLAARGVAIRLHEDGMRRSDDYRFNRFPLIGRDWGTVVIKVDDKSYECAVPSSLFKYTHGITDNGNTKRLPRPAEIRDR